MRLSRQFFFEKRKINNFPPLRSFCAPKTVAFVVFCFLVFVLLLGFCLIWLFVRSKCFLQKNWNCLDSLIYYTTSLCPYQPAYQEFICTHLFLFVVICENLIFLWQYFWIFFYLWEYPLIVRIFWNLYHLCESIFFEFLWKYANA